MQNKIIGGNMEPKEINQYRIKSYRQFNIVAVILAFMLIFLPVIIYFLRLIYPNYVKCVYYEITARPCPFCGFTSDLRNMLKGDIFHYKYNILSVPLVIGAIVEIICRIKILRSRIWQNKTRIKRIINSDILIHSILFVAVLVYIVLYFKLDLRRF